VVGDITEFFMNSIGAIVKLAKGPKYADSATKQHIVQISWYKREISKFSHRLYTIPKDLPQSRRSFDNKTPPMTTTTTFPTHNQKYTH
jgi:hypothetical protein